MKYLFIISFILVYVFADISGVGYSESSTLITHFTYMFQHVNLLHIVINSVGFLSLFNILQRFFKPLYLSLWIITIAFLASFTCMYDRVVVGASGIVYTLMGIYFYCVAVGKLRFIKTFDLYFSLTSLIAFMIVSFFNKNSATSLHIVCIISGFLSCAIPVNFKRYSCGNK